MKVRIGNDIRMNITLKGPKEYTYTNVKQIKCLIINECLDGCDCDCECGKCPIERRFPREPFPLYYTPTPWTLNTCGKPRYHTDPWNCKADYCVFAPHFHDYHWWPGYKGFGMCPKKFIGDCCRFHMNHAMDIFYCNSEPHCHHGHCKPCPPCPCPCGDKDFVYCAKVEFLEEPNKVSCIFPAYDLIMLGSYKVVLVVTTYELGWGCRNLHTETIDYGTVFELVDTEEGEQGYIVIDVGGEEPGPEPVVPAIIDWATTEIKAPIFGYNTWGKTYQSTWTAAGFNYFDLDDPRFELNIYFGGSDLDYTLTNKIKVYKLNAHTNPDLDLDYSHYDGMIVEEIPVVVESVTKENDDIHAVISIRMDGTAGEHIYMWQYVGAERYSEELEFSYTILNTGLCVDGFFVTGVHFSVDRHDNNATVYSKIKRHGDIENVSNILVYDEDNNVNRPYDIMYRGSEYSADPGVDGPLFVLVNVAGYGTWYEGVVPLNPESPISLLYIHKDSSIFGESGVVKVSVTAWDDWLFINGEYAPGELVACNVNFTFIKKTHDTPEPEPPVLDPTVQLQTVEITSHAYGYNTGANIFLYNDVNPLRLNIYMDGHDLTESINDKLVVYEIDDHVADWQQGDTVEDHIVSEIPFTVISTPIDTDYIKSIQINLNKNTVLGEHILYAAYSGATLGDDREAEVCYNIISRLLMDTDPHIGYWLTGMRVKYTYGTNSSEDTVTALDENKVNTYVISQTNKKLISLAYVGCELSSSLCEEDLEGKIYVEAFISSRYNHEVLYSGLLDISPSSPLTLVNIGTSSIYYPTGGSYEPVLVTLRAYEYYDIHNQIASVLEGYPYVEITYRLNPTSSRYNLIYYTDDRYHNIDEIYESVGTVTTFLKDVSSSGFTRENMTTLNIYADGGTISMIGADCIPSDIETKHDVTILSVTKELHGKASNPDEIVVDGVHIVPVFGYNATDHNKLWSVGFLLSHWDERGEDISMLEFIDQHQVNVSIYGRQS